MQHQFTVEANACLPHIFYVTLEMVGCWMLNVILSYRSPMLMQMLIILLFMLTTKNTYYITQAVNVRCWDLKSWYGFYTLFLTYIHTHMHVLTTSYIRMWLKLRMRLGNCFPTSCSFVTGVKPDMGSCCCSPSASRYRMLPILRCFSVQHTCKELLFELL